jgi:hypothetical protein
MQYVPHERLSIQWESDNNSFTLFLPWVSLKLKVTEKDKGWVKEATEHIHSSSSHQSVQRFIKTLKDYPIFYIQPRSIEEFEGKDLQSCPEIDVDCSTPSKFVESFGCEIEDNLKKDILPAWTWDRDKILSKAHIPSSDFYDPMSFVTYLICYRLEWENMTWSGQDGFGKFMECLLKKDEDKFFQVIGWISRQSWYVTTESCQAMEPALTHFEKGRDWINHFIHDEAGHYKFMEQVFEDIELNKEDFPVGDGTKWLLAAHKKTAMISPLAFSAMINLFEAAYYEGQDPISRVIKLSSKPHAARGFDLHYKINQEHRHCDMPVHLAACLAPQTYDHALLTLSLFELTLKFNDDMEQQLVKDFEM